MQSSAFPGHHAWLFNQLYALRTILSVMPPAVLFLIFNRPHLTAEVMSAIRAARPPRLYVAADGPREGQKKEEEMRCARARRIATEVDWSCEVKTLFRDRNLGCRVGVSSAIDWFFEHEEAGIILEDDCVPSQSFFSYCAELLDRYRDDKRIMAICGSSYAKPRREYKASYYFSYYADMWGWATWRRAWEHYDRHLTRWPEFKRQGRLKTFSKGQWWEAYWIHHFDATYDRTIDSWAYPWIYSVIEQGGLACYPVRSLVSNIGYGPDATHTVASGDRHAGPVAGLARSELRFPIVHPTNISRSDSFDRRIESIRLDLRSPSDALRHLWTQRFRRILTSPRALFRSALLRLVGMMRLTIVTGFKPTDD